MVFNTFDSMPFYPYRIILQILNNDNLCKLLKYNSYDCLSQPNLSYEQKIEMIWKNPQFDQMQNHNIFMTNTMGNMLTEATDILQIYRCDTKPDTNVVSTIAFRFDFLFGSKTAMVEYKNIPCNRGDVFEMELMKSLNGKDVAGVGLLQYNVNMSNLCGSQVGIGNNNTFTGVSVVMSTLNGDVNNDCSQ